MEPIQANPANDPVLARAFDFSREAKHRRELEQEAAARIANPLKQEPANRVTFSQEAQMRLNAEKTHGANLVQEVRNANKTAAAEERRAAIVLEHQQLLEKRAEAIMIREQRDSAASLKKAVAEKAVAANRAAAEKTASAAREISEKATLTAIEQRAVKAKELIGRERQIDAGRTAMAQQKETSDLLEQVKSGNIVKNREETAENIEVAIANLRKFRAAIARSKKETDQAVRMYRHVDAMGVRKPT